MYDHAPLISWWGDVLRDRGSVLVLMYLEKEGCPRGSSGHAIEEAQPRCFRPNAVDT